MTSNLSQTTVEQTIPVAWDAKLMLDVLNTPGFAAFNSQMDVALERLEAKWKHFEVPHTERESTLGGRRLFQSNLD